MSAQVLQSTIKYRHKGKPCTLVYYGEPEKARDKAAVLLMRGYSIVLRNVLIAASKVPVAPSLTH